jgi:4-hydroxyphenylpyruvate 3-dimethylallyltransferase
MTTTLFSDVQFMTDATVLAKALDAPYREESIQTVLEVYGEHFNTGAVLWKTTDRPGDRLYYRFFARERTNTVAAALRAGLIRPSALTELVAQWGERLGQDVVESCDFDCQDGMAKTWVYLGGMRPAEEVLDVPALPSALRTRVPALRRTGLTHIRFAAVDYRTNTINVYFRGRGPLTHARATEVLATFGIAAPAQVSVDHMGAVMPTDFCVAVTFAVDSGLARRACFYSLGIPEDLLPPLPQRLATFFQEARCQDAEPIRALGWSFGTGGQSYLKAEHAYCGDMAGRLRDWDCYLAGSDNRDPILDAALGATPAATVQVITPEMAYEGKQKMGLVAGICQQTVGSKALCMHLASMPPRTRGVVHMHDAHESSLYVTSGCTRTYFGQNLEHHVDSKAGELLYIPAGMPHLAANLKNEPATGVLARTDPNEQESVRLLPHLEDRATALFEADLARETSA